MSVRKERGFRTSKHTKDAHECEDQPIENIGLCITDFSRTISIEILSRLPLACVFWCCCVCKTWRNLIKDSEFARLHFSQAEAYPLIRAVGPTHVSRTLYFVDQPPKGGDLCYNSWSNEFEPKVNMKLDMKLKIPLNNVELAMSESEANMNLHSKRKRVTKLSHQDHKLNVVNSCNGFLCLSEPLRNNPVMVCNPITGEFIKLPPPTQSENESSSGHINCGLGFCPRTNQYKVIRMFKPEICECTTEPVTGRHIYYVRVAEIHTLGTNTWEMVGYAPSPSDKLGYCTYLNGALHWLYLSCDGFHPYLIAAFDFCGETFQSIAIPPAHHYEKNMDQNRISIGQLRSCLCVCIGSDLGLQDSQLWMMKTYGDQSSWTLELKIDMHSSEGGWLPGLYEPVCGIKSKFEAIPYIPSFYSLKDAVMVDGAEVYNIKSRCGGLKLQGESKAISLVQENAD